MVRSGQSLAHRALGQLTPAQADTWPPEPVNLAEHRIRRKQVLGGLTHEYYVGALAPPRCCGRVQVTTPNRIFEPHRSRHGGLVPHGGRGPGAARPRGCAPAQERITSLEG